MSTSALPWDRFGPEAEEELPPYTPPPTGYVPTPEDTSQTPPRNPYPPVVKPDEERVQPAPVVDWNELLDDAWPVIKEQLIGYVRGTLVAEGPVDHAHPTVTATTATGRELVVADAKSRSWRTLVQGLIFDVFAAIVAAVALLAGADPFVKETWIAFGVLLFKSVVSAVISYFMRLRVTPTMKNEEGEKMNVVPLPVPIPEKAA